VSLRDTQVWILCLVNLVLACLAILIVFSMMGAVAAMSPYVNSLPLVVALIVGIALSVTGILVARRIKSRLPRRVGILVQAVTLGLHSIIPVGFLAFAVSLLHSSKRERFLIPAGYMGDIYVLYNVADGEPARQAGGETTFRIPRGGILRFEGPMFAGPTRTAYFYEHDDGTLEKINNLWLSTVPQSPENLADKADIGVFFPRSGGVQGNSTACPIQFEQFYVGTKAYLLSEYREKNLNEYLTQHPIPCAGK
jgi:hypothetical protein